MHLRAFVIFLNLYIHTTGHTDIERTDRYNILYLCNYW